MRTRRGQGWLLRNIYPTLRRKLALYFRHGEMYAPCISSVRRIIRFTSMCESSHCFAQCKSVKGYRNKTRWLPCHLLHLCTCHCYKWNSLTVCSTSKHPSITFIAAMPLSLSIQHLFAYGITSKIKNKKNKNQQTFFDHQVAVVAAASLQRVIVYITMWLPCDYHFNCPLTVGVTLWPSGGRWLKKKLLFLSSSSLFCYCVLEWLSLCTCMC